MIISNSGDLKDIILCVEYR